MSDEPSNQETDRKASLASNFETLQNASHKIKPINAHSGASLVQCTEDPVPYQNSLHQGSVTSHNDDVTTICLQPVEGRDARYFSLNCSSLHNKEHEKIDVNGPYCEGLSGEIDDYSDCSTKDPEEGSYCEQTIVPVTFYIPERPQPIMLEVSPLVMQDGSREAFVTSAPTSSSAHGKYLAVASVYDSMQIIIPR